MGECFWWVLKTKMYARQVLPGDIPVPTLVRGTPAEAFAATQTYKLSKTSVTHVFLSDANVRFLMDELVVRLGRGWKWDEPVEAYASLENSQVRADMMRVASMYALFDATGPTLRRANDTFLDDAMEHIRSDAETRRVNGNLIRRQEGYFEPREERAGIDEEMVALHNSRREIGDVVYTNPWYVELYGGAMTVDQQDAMRGAAYKDESGRVRSMLPKLSGSDDLRDKHFAWLTEPARSCDDVEYIERTAW